DNSREQRGISLVVGLGEVGRPLLQILARAHRVVGIDLPPQDITDPVELMHVCFPAEIPDFVGATKGYVERYRPQVVVIHSTVPVGTTAAVQERVSVPVAHSPVRGKHARMVDDMIHYVKFVGAPDEATARNVAQHLEAAGFRTKSLSSPEATELAKLT